MSYSDDEIVQTKGAVALINERQEEMTHHETRYSILQWDLLDDEKVRTKGAVALINGRREERTHHETRNSTFQWDELDEPNERVKERKVEREIQYSNTGQVKMAKQTVTVRMHDGQQNVMQGSMSSPEGKECRHHRTDCQRCANCGRPGGDEDGSKDGKLGRFMKRLKKTF